MFVKWQSFFACFAISCVSVCVLEPLKAQSIADAARKAKDAQKPVENNNPTQRNKSIADTAIESKRMRDESRRQERPETNNAPSNFDRPNAQNNFGNPSPIHRPNRYPGRCPICGYYTCRCRDLSPVTTLQPLPALNPNMNPPPFIFPPNQPGPMQPGPMQPDRFTMKAASMRRSNDAARQRADHMIAEADKQFAASSFNQARLRYVDATKAAPDYAKAHFRLAHAYVALNRYDFAIEEYLLAIELNRAVDQFGFKLSELYAKNPAGFQDQVQLLRDQVVRNPNDGRSQFLLGVTLYYDLQTQEALPILDIARQLPGEFAPYAERFIPRVPAAAK